MLSLEPLRERCRRDVLHLDGPIGVAYGIAVRVRCGDVFTTNLEQLRDSVATCARHRLVSLAQTEAALKAEAGQERQECSAVLRGLKVPTVDHREAAEYLTASVGAGHPGTREQDILRRPSARIVRQHERDEIRTLSTARQRPHGQCQKRIVVALCRARQLVVRVPDSFDQRLDALVSPDPESTDRLAPVYLGPQ